jgi:segregation and condensation protein A
LYLIKKEEIDIYDIPIAVITKQYLEYVQLMKDLDLEVAGEFILMAATLIQIKVRMLLPRSPLSEEEEAEDPRTELVRQLLEYKRYKEVAESLTDLEERQSRHFPRTYFEWQKPYKEKEVVLKDMSMFDLLAAFKAVLDHMPKKTVHEIQMIPVTLEEQIEFMGKALEGKDHVVFAELMAQLEDRMVVIVTFMAILEMVRTRRIFVRQSDVFGEIWISNR